MIGHDRERGQVLVLFALAIVALLGMAALAIDVSGAYSEQRNERTVADAASLAGASDLFREGSTVVGAPEWKNARIHAMQNLVNQLTPGVPPPSSCVGTYDADIVNCPLAGTPYYVSVYAPAPSCAAGACDAIRSVQVTVRNPKYGLTFARLFKQLEWNLAVTSVAERSLGTNYIFVTLRPPDPSRSNSGACAPDCDSNEKDIFLDGTNTELHISRGDIGTNTNMTLTSGASVVLEPGSFVDRYDTYQNWPAPPPSRQIGAPIPDPGYPVPVAPPTGDLTRNFATNADGQLSAADCATEVTNNIPGSYSVSAADATAVPPTVVCYQPGAYNDHQGLKPDPGVTTMVFTPGVYFLNTGLMPGNGVRVIGGYEAGSPGVAFVFNRACSPDCSFAGNSADLVALNAGAAFPSGSGTAATAAVNWDTSLVQTTSKTPLPMTLIVRSDPACVVGPVDTCPTTNENANKALNLPGSGKLWVFGVQYAPTDNVTITGGSGSDGFLGQIWAWTVQYTGGSTINLVGAGDPQPGVLRIASPCSRATTCTNPESTATLP